MCTLTFTATLAAGFLSAPVSATTSDYKLVQEYTGADFFDIGGNALWSWWNTTDPTNGTVNYYAYEGAVAENLAGFAYDATNNETTAYIGVDSTNTYGPESPGRPSVRLTSEASFSNGGLFIADIRHSPLGLACGSWPALWLVGPNWPNQGEIDIIEGVNDQQFNQMTLHTGEGCSINNASTTFSGTMTSDDCTSANGDNTGCGISALDAQSYDPKLRKSVELSTGGYAFNDNGGGVYATLWTVEGINIYMFPASDVPQDIVAGNPDPSSWTAKPLASFTGDGCDYFAKFSDLEIVIDNTFCGYWAGKVWPGSSCAAKTGVSTCEAFVGGHPEAFKDAYWNIASIKVYQTSTGTNTGATLAKRDISELELVETTPAVTTESKAATAGSGGIINAHQPGRFASGLNTASDAASASNNGTGKYKVPSATASSVPITSDATAPEVFLYITAGVLFMVLLAIYL